MLPKYWIYKLICQICNQYNTSYLIAESIRLLSPRLNIHHLFLHSTAIYPFICLASNVWLFCTSGEAASDKLRPITPALADLSNFIQLACSRLMEAFQTWTHTREYTVALDVSR